MRKFSICFLCLKPGNFVKNFSLKYVCHNYKQRHHISICTKDENKNKNGLAAHVGVSSGILLKTAKAKLFNIKSDEKVATRLVLVSGSQRSYIEDNV